MMGCLLVKLYATCITRNVWVCYVVEIDQFGVVVVVVVGKDYLTFLNHSLLERFSLISNEYISITTKFKHFTLSNK